MEMTRPLFNRESFARAAKETGLGHALQGQSIENLCDDLSIFSALGVPDDLFVINDAGSPVLRGTGWAEVFSLQGIVDIARKLKRLERMKNFHTLAGGFSNPEQYSATAFEVESACFCLDSFEIGELEFAPEIVVNGGTKRPEFRITMKDGFEFFCECKSLASLNRIKGSKVMKLMPLVAESLKSILDDRWRVEISFKALPPHWNKNFSDQLFGAASELIRREYTEKHLELVIDGSYSTWIKLCKSGDPIFFQSTINVGDRPRDQSPRLIVSELPNIKRDIKNAIVDARTQLPEDRHSLIFLYSLNAEYAQQAISEWLQDNRMPHLAGVVSWTTHAKIFANPSCDRKIESLLNEKTAKASAFGVVKSKH